MNKLCTALMESDDFHLNAQHYSEKMSCQKWPIHEKDVHRENRIQIA